MERDAYLGAIVLAAFNYEPTNWLRCDGRLLPIAQNQALFSLLGTTYGGDGRTNFALPKLNADALQTGLQYIICVNGVYPSRPQ
jgi:microcystin-dependent protein